MAIHSEVFSWRIPGTAFVGWPWNSENGTCEMLKLHQDCYQWSALVALTHRLLSKTSGYLCYSSTSLFIFFTVQEIIFSNMLHSTWISDRQEIRARNHQTAGVTIWLKLGDSLTLIFLIWMRKTPFINRFTTFSDLLKKINNKNDFS